MRIIRQDAELDRLNDERDHLRVQLSLTMDDAQSDPASVATLKFAILKLD